MYTDDVTLFLTSPSEIPKFRDILGWYEKASGAKINVQKSMAVGSWYTPVNILGISYCDTMKILGIHFMRKTNQSAVKGWTTVTEGIRMQTRAAYYRELSLHQRIQYVHIYLLARTWFMAQVFQLPTVCERQINTIINLFLRRGVIFRDPLCTLQRRKLQGVWDLIHVGAKSRALLYFRLQTQSQDLGTLTAAWFQELELQAPFPNPPHTQRIHHCLEYLRQ
jgi:hypothetical protein